FDLASALARELYEVDRLGSFFDTIGQDPVLSQVKLIAEPWDVGSGGYQVGNFPPRRDEWDDQYRDPPRGYSKGDRGVLRGSARDGSQVPRTCTKQAGASPTRASTSSPRTTASRWKIS